MPDIIPRREVRAFSQQMELKLRKHDSDWGQSWKNTGADPLFDHYLLRELFELHDAIRNGTPEEIIKECADLANIAMMIADVCGLSY